MRGCAVTISTSAAMAARRRRAPLAIIIEPSRELAEQVYNEVLKLIKHVNSPALVPILLVGGGSEAETKKSMNALKHGTGVDIVVGTPGKLKDLCMRENMLDLCCIRFFILDEADRFTAHDKENFEMIMTLFGKCPKGGVGENRLQVRIYR